MKPKLLILELWGLGDLTIATPFLREATAHYEVHLLAKPFARPLQERFWPGIRIVPFNAPWTAFNGKYRWWSWPWKSLVQTMSRLRAEQFDTAVSARWDPRDHFLLYLTGACRRLGFPRLGSECLLTGRLPFPDPTRHRYEYWRIIGQELGLDMPHANAVQISPRPYGRRVVVHTGAGQSVRVWPLERFAALVEKMRERHYQVQVISNPEQREWWLRYGETEVSTPDQINSLLEELSGAAVFIGNDSGPGHLAAALGIPTFTLFGPQIPAWFVPLHPSAHYIAGKPCPYKPCSDYCRFAVPGCLSNVTEAEVWRELEEFLRAHVEPALQPALSLS